MVPLLCSVVERCVGYRYPYQGTQRGRSLYVPQFVMHHHDFNHVLSAISTYCLQFNVEYCIIGGDFNTDISRVNSMNTTSLKLYQY